MNPRAEIRKARNILRTAWANRNADRATRRLLREIPTPAPGQFPVAVYFADGGVNMYQMRQWYLPLKELAKTWPVLVISRAPSGARALLNDAALPTVYAPLVADLERVVADHDIRVVLYVNQNTRNFQMFRYGRRWHVFINHGESDKMYMTTNQFKSYDYALVAGQAARDRLSRTLWDYDVDQRTIEIGRPQADYYRSTEPVGTDDRVVVLYAPTWEGDRPASHYGSIRTHGEALVAALLATGKHRVIYRPHPRSGVVDREYGAANRRIIAAIEAANAADPDATHLYDNSPELGWQLGAADVAIVDISAMVYDRLAVDKPLLITRPVDTRAEIDEAGYLSDCDWLEASDAPDIADIVDRETHDPAGDARRHRWVEYYFGDTSPGVATARFHGAIETLMQRWDAWDARAQELPET